MTYDEARSDHEYLWDTYGPAHDMSGGYVDQDDLKKLLESPTKTTARQCYRAQIVFWFQNGPEPALLPDRPGIDRRWLDDPFVEDIAIRHDLLEEWERLRANPMF